MYYYRIAELTVRSSFRLASFEAFACEETEADVILEEADEHPDSGPELASGDIYQREQPDGWFYHTGQPERKGLYVSGDYTHLRIFGAERSMIGRAEERPVRIALECLLAHRGYVSLHAAAVELGEKAYAFTGPSGIGKSTRASGWIRTLGASLVSGDRPLIRVRDQMLYGVPWDGKEACFRNVCFPLEAICQVQRAETVCVREMTFSQRRELLMRQCFIPMWDTDTALVQMGNIAHLVAEAEIVSVFCGTSPKDVQQLYDMLQKRKCAE